ncbi:recombinase family protein [Bradyrhizobium liaoningense]
MRELVDEWMQIRGVMRRGDRKYILTDHIRIKPGDPCEVTVVKWIFDRFLEARSETVIAWELNQKGLVSSTGMLWTRAAVDILLRNEGYIGNLIFNQKSRKLRQNTVINPPEEWLRSEGCIEPIIDREVFFSVGKIIEERRVDLSEEEMLVRLRRTLLREGRLSHNAG